MMCVHCETVNICGIKFLQYNENDIILIWAVMAPDSKEI